MRNSGFRPGSKIQDRVGCDFPSEHKGLSILSATFFKNTMTDIQPLMLTAYLGVPDDVSHRAGPSKGFGEKEVGYIQLLLGSDCSIAAAFTRLMKHTAHPSSLG